MLLRAIFLTGFTCLRKGLILFISLHGSYLHPMLDTVIIFQSFRTILKISKSDVSFFTRPLRIFAKETCFSNICGNVLILRQNLITLLPKPTMFCVLFVFWLLGFSITGFVIKIVFTNLGTNFYYFYYLFYP